MRFPLIASPETDPEMYSCVHVCCRVVYTPVRKWGRQDWAEEGADLNARVMGLSHGTGSSGTGDGPQRGPELKQRSWTPVPSSVTGCTTTITTTTTTSATGHDLGWTVSFRQGQFSMRNVAVRLQQLSSCFWEMAASASEEGTWTNQHKHPPQESNHTAIHVQFTQTHAHSYFGDCVHQIVCYANKVMTSRKFEGYQYREGVFSWQNDSSLISLPPPLLLQEYVSKEVLSNCCVK